MPYRSDLDALESRASSLERDLAETRKAIASLKTLAVTIPTRCPADWNAMVGDDRVRFCEGCQRNVYNLSAMPAAEAEALIRDREGRLCARLYRRPDGTILTTECPSVVYNRRALRVVLAIGLLAAAIAAPMLFVEQGEVAQGAIAVEPSPPPPVHSPP